MKKEFLVNPNFGDFIRALNKHNVEYCITGAFAVSFHAEPRYTQDIDIYVAKNAENARNIAAAVKEFFGDQNNIDNALFTEDKVILRMGIQPNQIEISNTLSGLSEEDIIKHKVKSKFGDIETYYIGLNELLRNKMLVKGMTHRGLKHKQDERDYYMLQKVKDGKSGRKSKK